MSSILPREIRKLVQSQLNDLSEQPVEINGETLLIRDGEYCGHRYQAGDLSAIWFREENEVKMYDATGRVLRTLVASDSVSCSQNVSPSEVDPTSKQEDAA